MKRTLNKILIILGISFLVLFLTLAFLVAFGATEVMDRSVIEFVYNLRGAHSERQGAFYYINRILTEFGYVYFLLPACIISLVIGKGNLKSLFLSLGTGAVWLMNKGVKLIFDRERPDEIYRLMEETSSSFPSGHAMSSSYFYFFLAYLIYKSHLKVKLKRSLCILTVLMPIVIAITRVNLSVHYLTDVTAGIFLGAAFVCLFAVILENLENKKSI